MNKSFTLIEVVIVILIIAILVSLSLPLLYISMKERAYSAEALSHLSALKTTNGLYFQENSIYAHDLYDLADIGLLPDLDWGSQRTENYNFGISNEFGYYGKCSGYGGPSDYHGYTIGAWRIQPDDTLGAPQYHVHEEGPLCKTEMELPPFATGNITHNHDDYTHRHYIPQR